MTVSVALVGLAALSLFLYFRTRSRENHGERSSVDSSKRAAAIPEPAPPSPAAAAVPTGLAEDPAVNGSARRPGRILGRVIFPSVDRNRRSYSYQIYVFGADGKMDGPRAVANTDRFELANLPPGRKAVFFFSPTEFLTCPYQIADVPEGGECEVLLRPKACHALQGKVADANGTPAGGVYVTATESLSLPQELYLEGKPASIAGLETTVSSAGLTSPAGANPAEIPVWTLKLSPGEGRLSRGVITDAHGKFSVPLSSAEIPIPLTISRSATEVLKEELVIPSSGFARIIIPIQ